MEDEEELEVERACVLEDGPLSVAKDHFPTVLEKEGGEEEEREKVFPLPVLEAEDEEDEEDGKLSCHGKEPSSLLLLREGVSREDGGPSLRVEVLLLHAVVSCKGRKGGCLVEKGKERHFFSSEDFLFCSREKGKKKEKEMGYRKLETKKKNSRRKRKTGGKKLEGTRKTKKGRRDEEERRGREFRVPKKVKEEAELSLYMKRKLGYEGGTETGMRRAVQLSTRECVGTETLKQMRHWMSRHGPDARNGGTSYNNYVKWVSLGKPEDRPREFRGAVAWLMWGGDPAYLWIKEEKVRNALRRDFPSGKASPRGNRLRTQTRR